MIPLVVDPSEMHMARRWVAEAIADTGMSGSLKIGAMLETPRAALVAGELAEVSDFFSFGTNDLTQLVFAFSRDDVGSRLIPEYLRTELLEKDPFESLDQVGVGRIIQYACSNARDASAAIKIGVCGEQAGDPESAKFLVACGVDYVSCSPYRVPIARLAVAQALLEAGRVSADTLADLADSSPGAAEPVEHRPPAAAATESTGAVVVAAAYGDHEFVLLHALRIKGFAQPDVVAEIACVEAEGVEQLLAAFVERGLCKHIPARNLWQLTPDGRERHAELLRDVPGHEVDGLREHYDHFLDLNNDFKALCNDWQTKGGEPNDHTDADYDRGRIADLRALHQQAMPVVAGFRAAVPRFESYSHRLTSSLARLEGGETKMFTGVMCGSYHDVWMELHEDLVQLLGVDRHEEGSY